MTTERQLFEDATYNEDRMTAWNVWQAARAEQLEDAARYRFLCAHPDWHFVEHLCRQFSSESAAEFKIGMDKAIDKYRAEGTGNWGMTTERLAAPKGDSNG